MIDMVMNPAGYVRSDEVDNAKAGIVAVVKFITGICNNATYLVMMEAMKHLESHPRYIKRFRRLFFDAVREWKRYEGNLLYAPKNRFFHVDNMSDETRAKYGDITDQEYFAFWQGSGGTAYVKTKPLITSLANKFRVSFEKDGFDYPEILQWPMTALACMQMCINLWERATKESCQDFKVPFDYMRQYVDNLCIKEPYKAWMFALYTLEPKTKEDIRDKSSMANIELGVKQLYDAWTSPEILYGGTIETIKDYGEIFSGKNAVNRAVVKISELKHTIEDAIEQERKEKLINTLKNK